MIVLDLDAAKQLGEFEAIDEPDVGRLLIHRGRNHAALRWQIPDDVAAGWYRLEFPASERFQVLAQWLDEDEPFRVDVQASPRNNDEPAFASRLEGERTDLRDLPADVLPSTQLADWRVGQPLFLEPGRNLTLHVRRPMLIVGSPRLTPLPGSSALTTSLVSDAPFHMFEDEPGDVRFGYSIRQQTDEAFEGSLRVSLTDALSGETTYQTETLAIAPGSTAEGVIELVPPYGAYRLTLAALDATGQTLFEQQRHFTYNPAIDPHRLPADWPIAFHRHPRQPKMLPPVGFKWMRVWVGWSDLEPEPGRYDWSKMDEMVEIAERDGYLILWCAHGTPLWTLPESIRDEPRAFANNAPSDPERMRPFLKAFWDRYAPDGKASIIRAVETGNETNAHAEGWPADLYAHYSKVIAEETKQAVSNVDIVGVCMSGGLHLDYMRDALEAGLADDLDVASLHLYEIQNPVGDRSIAHKTEAFLSTLKEYDLDIPVWNTESGSPTDIRQDGVILTQEQLNEQIVQHPDFDPEAGWRIGRSWRGASEVLGTAWMIRATYQQFTLGVSKNFFFQWDAGPHHSWIADTRVDGGNAMPKIKIVATAVMSKMLLDYGPEPADEQPTLEVDEPDWLAFGHRYEGPKGRMTVVYVHPKDLEAGSGDSVATLAAGGVDSTAQGADNRSPWLRLTAPDPVRVGVPVPGDSVWLVDMFNRTQMQLHPVDGMVFVEATEVPQYIIEAEQPPARKAETLPIPAVNPPSLP